MDIYLLVTRLLVCTLLQHYGSHSNPSPVFQLIIVSISFTFSPPSPSLPFLFLPLSLSLSLSFLPSLPVLPSFSPSALIDQLSLLDQSPAQVTVIGTTRCNHDLHPMLQQSRGCHIFEEILEIQPPDLVSTS